MNYTNNDFCRAFAKKQGWIMKDQNEDNCTLLVPFIIMGVAYDYYRRDIMKLDVRHKAQYERSRFKLAYKRFNDMLFKSYDEDMADAFCDKMDNFQRWLYLDLVSLQAKMIRCLPADMEAKDKQVISAAMLINRFAQISQAIWGELYKINGKYKSQNMYLNAILASTRGFAKAYVKGNALMLEYTTEEAASNLFKALEDIEEKMGRFITFDMQA